MPRGRPALRPVPEPAQAPEAPVVALTPERQKLADTLAIVAALEAEIASTEVAIREADEVWETAYSERNDAERALERAKPKESTFSPMPKTPGAFWGSEEAYQQHVKEESTPPISIGEAREALARTQDAYDSAVRAQQFYKDRLKALENDLSWKRSRINEAVREVLRADPALAALAAEAKRLATRARAAAYAFQQVIGGDVIQPGSPFYGCTEPATYREDFEGWALSRAWGNALERLKTDPATPLPMVEPVP